MITVGEVRPGSADRGVARWETSGCGNGMNKKTKPYTILVFYVCKLVYDPRVASVLGMTLNCPNWARKEAKEPALKRWRSMG
jgi:hypothetical protein